MNLTLAPAPQSLPFLRDRKVEVIHFEMLNAFTFNSSYTIQTFANGQHLEAFGIYFCAFSCLLAHIFPFLHPSDSISPTISIYILQRNGTLTFSLAILLPQSQCQQIAGIDGPWCAHTLLCLTTRNSKKQQATVDRASGVDIELTSTTWQAMFREAYLALIPGLL